MAWCFSTRASAVTGLSKHPWVSSCLWVNSLGPSDAIWHWKSWSTLVQVMACCLTAPSHYLNQCWLIINKVWWHSSLKPHKDLPGANELKSHNRVPDQYCFRLPVWHISTLINIHDISRSQTLGISNYIASKKYLLFISLIKHFSNLDRDMN